MSIDWGQFDEVGSTELVISHAIECGAKDVHIVTSQKGADIFFVCDDTIEYFCSVPESTREQLFQYARLLATIDPYRSLPQCGYCNYRDNGAEFNLTIELSAASNGVNLCISICPL